MSTQVKIMADSTCDLSPDLVKEYDVTLIPLQVVMDGKTYEDGVDITPADIFKWSEENKTTPQTIEPKEERIEELFMPFKGTETEIVVFTISGEMSKSADIIRRTAEKLEMSEQVYVLDSNNLSSGTGQLVIEAALMAAKGSSGKEIFETSERLKSKVCSSFVIDTLDYLHRGGRCSGLTAFVGSAFQIHPRIDCRNGVLEVGIKYRGSLDKTVIDYAHGLEDRLRNGRPERIFITHSVQDARIVGAVRHYLESLEIFDRIFETHVGSVVSSHCGPGTLGIFFIEK